MEAYESVQEAVAGYADAHPEADNENLRNYLQDYVDEEKRTLQSGHEHSPAYVNAVNDGLTAAIIDVTHEEDVTIQQWAHLH